MRRIYIISKTMNVEDFIADAKANNCSEIAKGVPSILRNKVRSKKLPLIYEEPELPAPLPAKDVFVELDEIKARLNQLEGGYTTK